MGTNIHYRPMNAGEESAVCDLIARSFNEFVAPDYSAEGVQEFFRYAHPDALRERAQADHFVLVAEAGHDLAGMIEVRASNHVALLFVDGAYHRQGIATELFRRALVICQQNQPDLKTVSVNSSPYAVPIYEKLGFHATNTEQLVHGIRFIPMIMDV